MAATLRQTKGTTGYTAGATASLTFSLENVAAGSLIVACGWVGPAASTPIVSDNVNGVGSPYTILETQTGAGTTNQFMAVFYNSAAGAMTVTLSGTGSVTSCCLESITEITGASVLDQLANNSGNSVSGIYTAAPITSLLNGIIVVSTMVCAVDAAPSPESPFTFLGASTITNTYNRSEYDTGNAGTYSPTFGTAGTDLAASITASFAPPSSGGGGSSGLGLLRLLGVN